MLKAEVESDTSSTKKKKRKKKEVKQKKLTEKKAKKKKKKTQKRKLEASSSSSDSSDEDAVGLPTAAVAAQQQQVRTFVIDRHPLDYKSPAAKLQRAQRFTAADDSTNFLLEKSYSRVPDETTLRDEETLRVALARLKKRWIKESTEPGFYDYMCDQLKAIRQDLTVQGIRNATTLEVYQTHARVALEMGDFDEFLQCQTVISQLHDEGFTRHRDEFLAYRVLYPLYTKNTQDLVLFIASLSAEDRQGEAVTHAINVCLALNSDNYHQFFRLVETTPNMGAYLLDKLLDEARCAALRCVTRAYGPTIEVSFLRSELAFPDDEACRAFLRKAGAFLDKPGALLFTKESRTAFG